MLKVGIIGCGAIAQRRHLPEYAAREDVEIVAVSDMNRERAQYFAEQYGIPHVFAHYEQLLAVKELDAVSVCAPNHLHAEISIAAMNAGLHVLCEKPMATSLSEAQQMIECANKNGVYLMIAHNQRFMPVHQKAKEILDSGKLGKILSFTSTFGHAGPEYWSVDGDKSWFFDQNEAFAGALGDLGIHKADLIRWLLEDEVEELTSMYGTQHKKTNVEDHAVMILRMRQGVIGTITSSWTYYGGEDNSTVIYGENGCMKIGADPVFGVIVEYRNGEQENYKLPQMQSNKEGSQTHSGVIDHFVEGIVSGKGHLISGNEGLESLKMILQALGK